MAFYRTGTISLTNGSNAVTGVGTDFILGAAVGETIQAPDGKLYEILSIQSSTALTLGQTYLGATASGQAYSIVPTQSYIRDLASQAATLVNGYQAVKDTAGSGKFPDGTQIAPGIRFTSDDDTGVRRVGANSLALVAGGVDQATVSASGVDLKTGSTLNGAALADVTTAQTLTNKTINLASNTLTGTVAQFNAALDGADFATGGGTATGNNTGDQTAATVPNTPAGNIAATTVQAAINELDVEKAKAGANSDITSLVNPSLGSATAITQPHGDDTTKVATTAFVQAEISANGQDSPIRLNPRSITADFTIPSAYNATSAGPITISEGVTVTVQDNATWSIT